MTEAYEDEWMVRVRAQVMCRDEGTGGWLTVGGGGLSNVMLGRRQRTSPSRHGAIGDSGTVCTPEGPEECDPKPLHACAPNYDYFIIGKRISDQAVVLSCTIKKDFRYNKVMPTFHHWVTDEKRFGLTFLTAADARAFDKGVRTAVEELLDGLGMAWPSLHAYKKQNVEPQPLDDDEENNIFECLNLPTDSRSSSENSTASRPTRQHHDRDDITQTPILSAITLPSTRTLRCSELSSTDSIPLKPKMSLPCEGSDRVPYLDESIEADSYPYVHLTAVHEYVYPQVGPGGDTSPSMKPPLSKQDSGSFKKRGVYSPTPPPLPDKKPTKPDTFQTRIKCRHCHEWYLESGNGAGACEFAPDCFRSCIDSVSCIKCAQCMLYHCMSDAEGEFTMHPCSCAPVDRACVTRWVGLTILSILVPCLCCYGPLRCVHRAARSCHLAGGEHAPRVPPNT